MLSRFLENVVQLQIDQGQFGKEERIFIRRKCEQNLVPKVSRTVMAFGTFRSDRGGYFACRFDINGSFSLAGGARRCWRVNFYIIS